MEAPVVVWLWAVGQHCWGDWIGTYRYGNVPRTMPSGKNTTFFHTSISLT